MAVFLPPAGDLQRALATRLKEPQGVGARFPRPRLGGETPPLPAPPSSRTRVERRFWTRERVIEGLRRVRLDFQETPTSSGAYHRLTRFSGSHGNSVVGRRYPSYNTVLQHFPTLRQAWEAAGYQQDRWEEAWSELEDWYLREGAGLITRVDLATDLRRSPDAVHRRLYDQAIHSYQRWGWTPNRVERATGVTAGTLRKYLDSGALPYLRGCKVRFIDPADLLVVREIDWTALPPELERDVRRSLVGRIVTTLAGQDWRAGRPYQPHRVQTGRYADRRSRWVPPAEKPVEICRGDWVCCLPGALAVDVTRGVRCDGRVGLAQAVFWSSMLRSWRARVEFQKVRDRADRPRVTEATTHG